jgi:peptide/nickel transport system permease protein
MAAFLLKRSLGALLILFGVATILFFMFRMMPGDPTAQVISPALDDAAQARLKQAFGLDKSLGEQYLIYIKNMATLEWGRSFTSGEPVASVLGGWLANTVLLMSAGLLIAVGLGVSLGMMMAWWRNVRSMSAPRPAMILQAAPPFVAGILLLILLNTGSTCSRRVSDAGSAITGCGHSDVRRFLHHLVLPTITITALSRCPP